MTPPTYDKLKQLYEDLVFQHEEKREELTRLRLKYAELRSKYRNLDYKYDKLKERYARILVKCTDLTSVKEKLFIKVYPECPKCGHTDNPIHKFEQMCLKCVHAAANIRIQQDRVLGRVNVCAECGASGVPLRFTTKLNPDGEYLCNTCYNYEVPNE